MYVLTWYSKIQKLVIRRPWRYTGGRLVLTITAILCLSLWIFTPFQVVPVVTHDFAITKIHLWHTSCTAFTTCLGIRPYRLKRAGVSLPAFLLFHWFSGVEMTVSITHLCQAYNCPMTCCIVKRWWVRKMARHVGATPSHCRRIIYGLVSTLTFPEHLVYGCYFLLISNLLMGF